MVKLLLFSCNNGVLEPRRLNLFELRVGVCLDGERSEQDAVILFRRGWFGGFCGGGKSGFHVGAERIHTLFVFREPVRDVAVVAGNPQLVTFRVADDVLLG